MALSVNLSPKSKENSLKIFSNTVVSLDFLIQKYHQAIINYIFEPVKKEFKEQVLEMYRKKFKKVESNLLSLATDQPWMSKCISLQESPIMKVFVHRIHTFLRILSIFAESFFCVCVPVIKLFFLLSQIPFIICLVMLGLVLCKPCFSFTSWIFIRHFILAEIFGSSIQHFFVC